MYLETRDKSEPVEGRHFAWGRERTDPEAMYCLFVLILYVGVSSTQKGEYTHCDHEDCRKRFGSLCTKHPPHLKHETYRRQEPQLTSSSLALFRIPQLTFVPLVIPACLKRESRTSEDLDARLRGHDFLSPATASSSHLARGSDRSLVLAPFNCGIRDYS